MCVFLYRSFRDDELLPEDDPADGLVTRRRGEAAEIRVELAIPFHKHAQVHFHRHVGVCNAATEIQHNRRNKRYTYVKVYTNAFCSLIVTH